MHALHEVHYFELRCVALHCMAGCLQRIALHGVLALDITLLLHSEP